MSRSAVSAIHRNAAILAFLTILTFWSATAATELWGNTAAITTVKQGVLAGMVVLIPAIVAAGVTGYRLGGRSFAPKAAAKRRRMPVIALNGVLVLVPAATFLAFRATEGSFDAWFVAVQAAELAAGGLNIALMALNIRDGMILSGRMQRAVRQPKRSNGMVR
jgi:hypothetical protein